MKKSQLVDLNLINVKIPTRMENFVDAGISIEGNRIYKIAKPPNMPKASETIDVQGNIALPGLIDVHVHLRDLKLGYKEDFFTGTCAAAAGGFTTVLDMPNTQPPTNTPVRLREKIRHAQDRVIVNVGFYAAFPKKHEDISEMIKKAFAFKVFLYQPVTELDVNDDEVLREVFKNLDRPVAVHAEEGEVIQKTEDEYRKFGKTSLNHYLKAHSVEREVNAVQRMLNLAVQTGTQIHFCHMSTAQSITRLTKFKPQITCEITPHHLLLTKEDLHALKGVALMNPPLRSSFHTSRLWDALSKGLIDVIASDHAPHAIEEKRHENVWEISPGIPGLETVLPLMITQANLGRITWHQLIQLLTINPSEIFKLGRGSIQEGEIADLVIVDNNQEYKIDSSKFHSKAKYSPFDGWKVKGRPIKTFVRGKLVYDSGEILVKPGSGNILHP